MSPDLDLKVQRHIYYAQLLAYALIVLIGCVGFYSIGQVIHRQSVSQLCTEQFLGTTVESLNQRTKYATAQADANIDLQKAQLRFIRVLVATGKESDSLVESALAEYFTALQTYTSLVSLQNNKAKTNPYPTREDYRACLASPVRRH